jgi:hypothetical protein
MHRHNFTPFGSIEKIWVETILGTNPKLAQEIQDCLTDISNVVCCYSEYWHTKDTRAMTSGALEIDSRMVEADILDVYFQTLLNGCISSRERLSQGDMRSIMSFSPPSADPTSTEHEFFSKVCAAFEAGMRRRRLALTKNAHIGAVPEETQIGDLVCVLFGCSVPIILRKQVESGNQRSYMFVGESYFHGFMDAEAIVLLVKGLCKVQDFDLV